MDINDMNQRIPEFGAIVATVLLLLAAPSFALPCNPCTTCDDPRPEDTLICGCESPLEPGMLICSSAAANVGESFTIPISVHAISTIDALTVDMTFPANLIRYDSTSAGALTAPWTAFDGNEHPNGGLVRFTGFEIGPDAILPDTVGELALLHFTVLAAGCGPLCFDAVYDDLQDYEVCTAMTGPVASVEPTISSTWGLVKGMYR